MNALFLELPESDSPEFAAYFGSRDRFSQKVGYKALSASPGKSEYEIETDESFFNPVGSLHGGVLFSAMDSSAGAAVAAWIKASGRTFKFMATASAEIKYLKGVKSEKIKIVTEITEHKGSVVKLLSKSLNEQDETVAELHSVWVVKFED
ncbi:PaaI family thioesterase [Leptospira yasudae]|uniref:PaaI family thioesterase n=1 Tax=Leptospira yasudae TaxID=2202201 RepID=A0A5F2BBD9_9LEPT|nr:PaaI family thioesterase [Leptospira yasudae]RHX80057.1 PaaI family thioesterase [Leptospira yasudae]TGK25816.1 PaaI family thioesterase [Leptospira yasudae]TGL76314.1 PaaI family thioesterase [Leptospira yasudae]TGL82432.1 PaaI family thioesterase [Leptospira yasudae]TGL84364.1 PaaI family thioesterase [Leptospira yasudae]